MMADIKIVGEEDTTPAALKVLLFFSLLMVTVPISLYFFTKSYVFEGIFKMNNMNSYFYAAIVAILAVHVVLAMFIYVAWTEGQPKKATYKAE